MSKIWKPLIAGIALVFALHYGFGMLLLLICAIAGSGSLIYNIGTAIFPWPGLTQFFYLVPIVMHYRKLGKFEIVKGISIGAVITLFLTSTCFGYSFDGLRFDFRYLMLMTIVLMIATYRWFNYRR